MGGRGWACSAGGRREAGGVRDDAPSQMRAVAEDGVVFEDVMLLRQRGERGSGGPRLAWLRPRSTRMLVGERLRRIVVPLVLFELGLVGSLGALVGHSTRGNGFERAVNSAMFAEPGTAGGAVTFAVSDADPSGGSKAARPTPPWPPRPGNQGGG